MNFSVKTTNSSLERLLTIDELADILQVPKSWIYERTRLKKIPFQRVGKYVRFNRAEINDWLRNSSSFSFEKTQAKRRF